MTTPVVFLDRDGVIIENRDDFVKSWDEVEFLPGAIEALRRLSQFSQAIVLVTNQSAVGRQLLTLDQAEELNRQLVQEIERRGGRIDACYMCPHHPQAGCDCRKPAPGLLLQAGAELHLDLGCSYLIGDASTDLQAARAAGVSGILVRTGRGAAQAALMRGEDETHWPVVADLGAAVTWILEMERREFDQKLSRILIPDEDQTENELDDSSKEDEP